MTDIKVWLYGVNNPLVFPSVEEHQETKDALIIIQEEMYKTITTKIYKQSLIRSEITEHR